MKKGRREAIIELIRKHDIENQSEIVKKLKDKGYDVTQATVSRDIEKLNLIKVKKNGKVKYAIVESPTNFEDKYIKIISTTFKSMTVAKNLLIYKTGTGEAMATATAIDGLCFDEIIGSIAGDDVIFIATKDEDMAMMLMNKLDVIRRKVTNA